MKLDTIKLLCIEAKIIDYVGGLWKTDAFQESHRSGWIREIVLQLAKAPVIFFEMSHPSIEGSHFSSWWRAISKRKYDNDYISDLYYLHEIYHAATMGYDPDLTFAQWFRKMGENELEASLVSEALAHLYLDGVREGSFDHEIWVDRFIDDYKASRRRMSDGESFEDKIRKARVQAMSAPNPYDFCELQIANYGRQNLDWCIMWKDARKDVEAHMRDFLELAATDRWEAGRMHMKWVVARSLEVSEETFALGPYLKFLTSEGATGIPFKPLAEEFARLGAKNKEKYGNHLLS